MKIVIGILAVMILTGCAQENNSAEAVSTPTIPQQEAPGYRHIHDNLYTDQNGNLYLKTVDVSTADSDNPETNKKRTLDSWLNVVYCDTCSLKDTDEHIDGVTELKYVVDTATFHLEEEVTGGAYYSDKNFSYFHKFMADGGTITLSSK